MIILNFSHPLTEAQLSQIESLAQMKTQDVRQEMAKFDNGLPFAEQVREMVTRVGLSSGEWQGTPLLVNPPGYAPAAMPLLAELHGRTGYFPAMIRLRPVAGVMLPTFEVGEIVNLNASRKEARMWRFYENKVGIASILGFEKQPEKKWIPVSALSDLTVVNFSHPLTEAQLSQIESLAQMKVQDVRQEMAQFDSGLPFAKQVHEMVTQVGLSAKEWQSVPLLINAPGYAPAAMTLLAELHGRMGYFPTMMRMRPVAGAMPPRFEVGELLDLQSVRQSARELR